MEKVAIPPRRVMRIIWFGFVLSGVMVMYVVLAIPAQAPGTADAKVEAGLTMAALVGVVLGFFAPRIFKRSMRSAIERRGGSPALNVWMRTGLVSLAWIYSCNLFALALHFMGARAGLVELLFAAGMISLLLWRPGAPPDVQAGTIRQG
jgi:hypothetical protein